MHFSCNYRFLFRRESDACREDDFGWKKWRHFPLRVPLNDVLTRPIITLLRIKTRIGMFLQRRDVISFPENPSAFSSIKVTVLRFSKLFIPHREPRREYSSLTKITVPTDTVQEIRIIRTGLSRNQNLVRGDPALYRRHGFSSASCNWKHDYRNEENSARVAQRLRRKVNWKEWSVTSIPRWKIRLKRTLAWNYVHSFDFTPGPEFHGKIKLRLRRLPRAGRKK